MKIKVVEYEAPQKFSEWLDHIGATIVLKNMEMVRSGYAGKDWEAQIENAAFIWRGDLNSFSASNSISGHGDTPEFAVQDLCNNISSNQGLKIILNRKTIQVPSNLQWDSIFVSSTETTRKVSVLAQVRASAVREALNLILPGVRSMGNDCADYTNAALIRVAEKMVSGS